MDMDVGDIQEGHEKRSVKDIPPVPIKTYKWEDVRRAKLRGNYPYTHLRKDRFNDEDFEMDLKKEIKKSSSGVEIQEIEESVALEDKKKPDVIITSDDKDKEQKNQQESEGIVESADSSADDNISQYLDKDDKVMIVEDDKVGGTEEVASTSKDVDSSDRLKVEEEDNRANRAKSEEPKRKRKLSIESAYSRISLPKFGVLKKLRAAKDKIKSTFSKSEPKLNEKNEKIEKNEKKSKKDKSKDVLKEYVEPKITDDKPVYIHIPLKPPPGQTDEFSYLEFEDPTISSTPTTKKSASPSPKPEDDTKEIISNDSKSPNNNGNITNDVQFIILTAPSDDEVLDDATIPESASSADTKFFDGTKLKELKSIAKGCMDDIASDAQIDGIIFEDVIQVEYVDEHNNPIGTTERSSFIEINEETLPTIEKQLSQRNILEELQKEVTSSMDSINKLVRNRSLRSLRSSPNRTRSNEGLKDLGMTKEAPELSSLPSMKKTMSLKETRRTKDKKKDLKEKSKNESKKESENESKKESEKELEKVEQKMFVDEEDGLKISEDAMKLINEELEKENQPKTTESQLKASVKDSLKKTVSFRRKSKQDDPDGVYEDVKVSNGKDGKLKDIKVLDSGQSMSVDEEKAYLDEKMIKSTSLEEDYNKWSKLTDHEYEPINPPTTSSTSQPQQEIKPAQIKPSLKKPTSIRIPLHDDVIVQDESIETEEIGDEPPGELTPTSTPTTSKTPEEGRKNKFQEAFKSQAGKIRTKFKNIKRPQNLDKLKIKKPNININVPKIPDTVKVNLPSFTLPKKTTVVKTRQYSTESNVGGTKKKFFDFSTYPRIFKRKDKNEFDDLDVTLPRKSKDKEKKKDSPKKSKDSPKVIRIPLHSEDSMDREDLDLSRRYDEDIEIENDYLRESQEMHEINKANVETQKFNQDFNKYNIEFNNDLTRNRWKHGKFYGENLNEIDQNEDVTITDLDNDNDLDVSQNIPDDTHQDYNIQQDFNNQNQEIPKDFDIPQPDYRSISSSGDVHRRGVLEEIDSDEFFLREKGISQDNIEIGAYLSSQIKETFKPINKIPADDSFETDQSVQETPKRRPMKKPKRKKTPNVSREQISYERESEPEEEKIEVEPIRPKRKPKKGLKKDENEFLDYHRSRIDDNELRRAVSDNVLGKEDDHHFYDGDFRKDFPQMYENEQMEGIDQPNILLSDPYEKENVILSSKKENGFPEAPPRKQKSLKSLVSEHDSIIDEITYVNQNKEIGAYRVEHEYIIPTPEEPPQRPSRTRSRTRSQSRTNQSERDLQEIEEQMKFEEQLQEQQSHFPDNNEEPCVEEPCVQTVCDYMGYAIIDKSKQRDPPLPPPPRKKRSAGSPTDVKFFTCPRPLKDDAPIRPTRNYSTLMPKSSKSSINGKSAEKENVDIGQYIEIEDEEGHSRLQSGDVVKKMKDRPLPAPPRPPRSKGKEHSKSPLSDITNLNNVDDEKDSIKQFHESEVSVQTEPLPEGFVCEELVEEKGDKVLTPRQRGFKEFEHQETITHGALVVAPVPEKYEEGPITQFSRSTEKIITIRRETDDEPKKKEPETKIIERIIEKPVQLDQVQVLKAQKLQIEDLDVNRLTVNELLASKIKVSEIEGDSMKISEINPEGGNVIVGGIEFSGNFLKGLIGQLETQKDKHEASSTQEKIEAPQKIEMEESKKLEEKKIPEEIEIKQDNNNIKNVSRIEAEEIANDILSDLAQELNTPENQHLLHHFSLSEQKKTPIDPPTRPPRQTQKIREEMKELEERILQDDFPELTPESTPPPPRPPQPVFPSEFQEPIWSQPPPSFYMLRSPLYSPFMDSVDIPSPPRRKRSSKQQARHQHSESSSEDVNPPSRGRRHRTPTEPTIPQLAAQLTGACLVAGDKAFKRLIKHITANVLRNSDGRQDLHVTVVILLVLIAGLILLGSGGGGTTVHMHHWEYFNPPRDI